MIDYIDRKPLVQKAKEIQGKLFGAPLIVREIERAPSAAPVLVEEVVNKIRAGIKENMFNPNNKFDFIYDEIFDVLDKVLEEYNGKKDT